MSLKCTKQYSAAHQVSCLNAFDLTYEEWFVEMNTHWSVNTPNGLFTWVNLAPSLLNIEDGIATPKDWAGARSIMMNDPSDVAAYMGSYQSFNPSDVPFNISHLIEGHFIEVLGCTDPTSENFNAESNTDDGSCYYMGDAGVELGCKNQNALNYNPSNDVSACEDCCVMDYVGCTNATATNFDPVATEPCVNCCEFLEDTTTTTTNTTVTIDDEEWYEDTTTLAMIGGGVLAVGLLVWAFKK